MIWETTYQLTNCHTLKSVVSLAIDCLTQELTTYYLIFTTYLLLTYYLFTTDLLLTTYLLLTHFNLHLIYYLLLTYYFLTAYLLSPVLCTHKFNILLTIICGRIRMTATDGTAVTFEYKSAWQNVNI